MGMRQICGYLWAGFFVIWIVWGLWTKPVQRRLPLSSRWPDTVLTLAGFWLMFASYVPGRWLHVVLFPANRSGVIHGIEIAGVALTVAGLAFAMWARTYLAGNWSGTVTVKVGHELVRTGPYRWVRHPIYSGLILALLGTALDVGEARGLVAVVLLYIGFKLKSQLEERLMRGVFGVAYDDYSRSTGAIIPRLHF
jgi:protein-S-isoprenylcysteine O-methyltransferase Ste14